MRHLILKLLILCFFSLSLFASLFKYLVLSTYVSYT
nr:MAG TPA: hypothetical protein [Caudoviricetes sp.]